MTATIADWAIAYASNGWPVFHVHNVVSGACSCGNSTCKRLGKHPRTKHGLLDASTDPAVLGEWWRQSPSANIGLRTGDDIADTTGVDHSTVVNIHHARVLRTSLPAEVSDELKDTVLYRIATVEPGLQEPLATVAAGTGRTDPEVGLAPSRTIHKRPRKGDVVLDRAPDPAHRWNDLLGPLRRSGTPSAAVLPLLGRPPGEHRRTPDRRGRGVGEPESRLGLWLRRLRVQAP